MTALPDVLDAVRVADQFSVTLGVSVPADDRRVTRVVLESRPARATVLDSAARHATIARPDLERMVNVLLDDGRTFAVGRHVADEAQAYVNLEIGDAAYSCGLGLDAATPVTLRRVADALPPSARDEVLALVATIEHIVNARS
jgi:hypothetical protein